MSGPKYLDVVFYGPAGEGEAIQPVFAAMRLEPVPEDFGDVCRRTISALLQYENASREQGEQLSLADFGLYLLTLSTGVAAENARRNRDG